MVRFRDQANRLQIVWRLEPAAWDRPHLRAHFIRTLELPGVRRMVEEQKLELPDWASGPG